MTTRPRVVAAAVLATALVYIGAWLVLPRSGLFINDNGAKLIQTEGLVRNGGIDVAIPWPGKKLDPRLDFPPFVDPFGKVIGGRLFVSFPIPFAVVTSLPFRFFGIEGNTLLPLLGGLLLLPAVAMLARLLGAGAVGTWFAVLGVGLGTPVWFYAYTLWEHLPAPCLATWGLVLLLRAHSASRATAWSALLCGLAVWMRDDLILFALAMAVVPIAMSDRGPTRAAGWGGAAGFLALLALTLVPLGLGHWIVLGTPFGIHATTHGPFDAGIVRYFADRWTVFRDLVLDSHRTDWISLAVGVPYVLLLAFVPRLEARRFVRAAEILLVWAIGWGAAALVGHLTSRSPVWYLQSANGLFAVSPLLALSGLRARDPAPVPGLAPSSAGRPRATGDRVARALWLVVLIDLGLYSLAAPPLHVA